MDIIISETIDDAPHKMCINRCIGYNKNHKKCRAITKNNALFCSPCHEPLNRELIEDGCFMCMEYIKSSNDIIYFRCKHAFHKDCYFEWLNVCTYKNPICMVCRGEIDFLNQNTCIIRKKYSTISDNLTDNINKLTKLFKIY